LDLGQEILDLNTNLLLLSNKLDASLEEVRKMDKRRSKKMKKLERQVKEFTDMLAVERQNRRELEEIDACFDSLLTNEPLHDNTHVDVDVDEFFQV
jgi:signal transduction protein with GAF and PtsI domain